MQLTDTLNGLKVEANFSVKNDKDVQVNGCRVNFTLDGVSIKTLLDGPVRKSLVIDFQRALRKLSEQEIKDLCVNKVHTVHYSAAGHKIESPEEQKARAKAVVKQMSKAELKAMLAELEAEEQE